MIWQKRNQSKLIKDTIVFGGAGCPNEIIDWIFTWKREPLKKTKNEIIENEF